MTGENALRRAMLAADGISTAGISAEDRETLRRLLDGSKRRFRRLKWAASLSWAALFPVILLAGLWARANGWHVSVGAQVAFVSAYVVVLDVAIALTIAFMIRAYYLQRLESRTQVIELSARVDALEARFSSQSH